MAILIIINNDMSAEVYDHIDDIDHDSFGDGFDTVTVQASRSAQWDQEDLVEELNHEREKNEKLRRALDSLINAEE